MPPGSPAKRGDLLGDPGRATCSATSSSLGMCFLRSLKFTVLSLEVSEIGTALCKLKTSSAPASYNPLIWPLKSSKCCMKGQT